MIKGNTIFALAIFGFCTGFEIHKHMTLDELRSTFHVDSHHLVPEYEIVPIQHHHIRKRSLSSQSTSPNNINHLTSKNNLNNNSYNLLKPSSKTWNTKQNLFPPPTKTDVENDGKQKQYENIKKILIKESNQQGQNDQTKIKNFELKAFGMPFNLSLVPTDGLLFKRGKLKIFTVEPNVTAQHGVEYVEHPESHEDEDIGELYQDEENQAAILLRREGDAIVMEGSIGPHLIIRPIPSRLRSTLPSQNIKKNRTSSLDDEIFLDDDGEMSAEIAIDTGLPISRINEDNQGNGEGAAAQGHHHIVIKRKNYEDDMTSDYAFMEPDHIVKRYKRSTTNSKRTKREAPYTIYPEILVIVDYDGYRLHGGDNLQIKRYFISFWNGVDLRYKLLKGPKIRVSIAGIIISRGRDATPYLERNRVGRDAIDSAAALTDMGKYLFRERRLPVYDIAVAITKYDMCRRRKGGRCTKGTAGFAYVGGACVVNKRLEKVNSVAIIEDTGGFSGIIVAAHEVGHLLGAVHDGSPPPSYLGGPGAEKCQWTDGFIMSDLRHTERGFRWSPCSVASFHHFLNGDTATCLYNAPHEDESLPRVLPGKLLSLDAQCKRDRGTSACFKDDRVCAQLFCFDSGSGYCVAYRPAAEGSSCGDGQYCLNGRCVAEHENIIPDYSQNTPSYVRPNGYTGRPLFHENEEANYNEPLPPDSYKTKTYSYKNNNYNNIIYNNNNYNQFPSYTTTTTTTTTPPPPFPTRSSTSYPWGWFTSTSTPPPPSTQSYYSNQYNYPVSSSSQSPPPHNYFIFYHQTTKNPYDFGDFGKKSTILTPNQKNSGTIRTSLINNNGGGYNNDVDINNNYLKRSYNAANYYYGDSSDVKNSTLSSAIISRTGFRIINNVKTQG